MIQCRHGYKSPRKWYQFSFLNTKLLQNYCTIKREKPETLQSQAFTVVEARGVEPLSETLSSGASPGAVND